MRGKGTHLVGRGAGLSESLQIHALALVIAPQQVCRKRLILLVINEALRFSGCLHRRYCADWCSWSCSLTDSTICYSRRYNESFDDDKRDMRRRRRSCQAGEILGESSRYASHGEPGRQVDACIIQQPAYATGMPV